ncbi:uncharacterized protein K452DRAFT_297341 [Aplosporella prunicola CBS 121167]|uniref:Signal peptidase complex catalytic subunit SEC11 n=1 Tax=Aplosporella prunicola CBS 121167 TaxID=1176127 RepID=A0A6A6BF59_9PEZI|nr:uncharacterized protein K452DRAFT_297341 [Aplosporella prunicola CBS 121167]KAF2142809.1 hypothetical protein K452DRAFT_297341 [Aplosporella prunicola CBS 121167]
MTSSFMLYRALSLLTDSSSPIVVVVSESMAPAFHRGDILFLWNRTPVISAGDIPVVWFKGRELPMVHRAIRVHWKQQLGSEKFVQHVLTKGDNNQVDDVSLYPPGRQTVLRDEVVGLNETAISP